MVNESELQELLRAWIREYGPGGLPSEKVSNFIQTLMDHKGFVPSKRGYMPVQIRTVADDVESAICAMETTPAMPKEPNVCYVAAKTLRAYYLTPKHWPEDERLLALRKVGLPMSRHTYYRNVQLGRAFLMGYLTPKKCVA